MTGRARPKPKTDFEKLPAGPCTSYFDVRNVLNWETFSMCRMQVSERYVLDVLLMNAMYDGDDYGNVTKGHTTEAFLMRRTGLAEATVKRARKALEEDYKAITRTGRRISVLPFLERINTKLTDLESSRRAE